MKLSDNESFVAPQMTLFEINQQIISQLPIRTHEELKEDLNTICDFDEEQKSDYYMLLCKEISYFTIFEKNNNNNNEFNNLGSAVIACILEGLGDIVSIDKLDTEVEIWVKTFEGDTVCLHLFNYAQGIVTITR